MPRMVRITCDVEWERMDTILSVLHQEVTNVHVDEIEGQHTEPLRKRVPGTNFAVAFYWPLLKPVMEKTNGNAIYIKSPEVRDIFLARGRNPNGASTVFTQLARAGLIEWVGKGLYRLKQE